MGVESSNGDFLLQGSFVWRTRYTGRKYRGKFLDRGDAIRP